MSKKLKTPFPYFGGKSAVANLVWQRLGDVDNYVEPFCGSVAVLLRRPHPPQIETVNDLDCYLANFWRATQRDPEAVAAHADWPVNEADLHSRHRWLVLSDDAAAFRQKMRADPEHYDARIAGWWCWGLCCWIGGGWCTTNANIDDSGEGKAFSRGENQAPCNPAPGLSPGRRPAVDHCHGLMNGVVSNSEAYLAAQGRPQLADAQARGRGVHSNDAAGTCAQRRAWLVDWFGRLRDRLRTVRVCCGDWSRVCDSDSVTVRLGTTGIFFDPPYGAAADRNAKLYAQDSLTVADDVRAYCLERGSDPRSRIALCGYQGEHEALEQHGWEVVAWKAQGGYGNRSKKGKDNAKKERIWFSPFTLKPNDGLFAGLA